MTTILTDKRLAHIGRRSEHAPDDGMMFRRRLIRSDEAWLGPSRSARPWACRASAHYQRVSGERSDRAVGDERLPAEIGCVHKANYAGAYGSRRVYKQLLREGNRVAHCTVERLIAEHGIQKAKRRGRPWRTPDPRPRRGQRR